MLSNLFWLIVAPAIAAFILGLLANAFRTMAVNVKEEITLDSTSSTPLVEPKI